MVLVVLVALLSAATAPVRDDVCVVAHLPSGVEARSVDVDLVRRLFLVRQRFWPDGSVAHPVNLPANSPVRDTFSRVVLGRSVKALAPYWSDRYFHGTRPPPTVASAEAMQLFLERTPGSVGYVAGGGASSLPAPVISIFCLGPEPSR